ncbi:MAG: DUF1573 domain-containing protein [Acidobacteriota bacterium]
MKTLFSVLLCVVLPISASAQSTKFTSGIFLHHSTGYHIWGPNDTTVSVPQEITAYNKAHNLKDSSAFSLEERHWPVAPDNEWVRWRGIFDNKDTTADIRPILAANKIVVIKSCFPSCQMTGEGSTSDTLKPEAKTIYNYKWHLRSIVRTMKKHPENFFIIWTNAPLTPRVTTDSQATLSNRFCTWMKDTLAAGLDAEFGAFPNNAFVFDYYHKTAGKDGKLLWKYAVDSVDSHPNKAATVAIAPVFVKEMFDAILAAAHPPVMSTDRSSIAFGDRARGIPITQSIVVSNASPGQLLIDSVRTRTRQFSAAFTRANVTQRDSSVVKVVFTPDSTRAYKDTLFLYTNASVRPSAIPLSGNSPSPRIMFSPAALDFGSVMKSKTLVKQLSVSNSSVNALTIDSMVTRTSAFRCAVASASSRMNVLTADTLTLNVSFTPDSVMAFTDTLMIFSNAMDRVTRLPLSGVGEKITAVERVGEVTPTVFALDQNYPNPFNPSTTIRFSLAERSRVSLVVYDVTGRTASVLANGEMPAGAYTATFDGGTLASGVYFYRLHAVHGTSVFTETRRFVLMK